MDSNDRRALRGAEGYHRGARGLRWFWAGNGMTRKEAVRSVEVLLDGYQEILDAMESDEGNCECEEDVEEPDLVEEAWQIRDAGIARIEGICQALELLGYHVWRDGVGSWRVRSGG